MIATADQSVRSSAALPAPGWAVARAAAIHDDAVLIAAFVVTRIDPKSSGTNAVEGGVTTGVSDASSTAGRKPASATTGTTTHSRYAALAPNNRLTIGRNA